MCSSQVPYEECACLDLLGEETHQGCVVKNVGQQRDVHARRGNARQGRASYAENRFLSLPLPQNSSWGFWSCPLIASFVYWVFSSQITSWEEKDISWSLRDTMQASRKIQALQDCRISCSPKYPQLDTTLLDIINFSIREGVCVFIVCILRLLPCLCCGADLWKEVGLLVVMHSDLAGLSGTEESLRTCTARYAEQPFSWGCRNQGVASFSEGWSNKILTSCSWSICWERQEALWGL